jgi:putative membrane protein
MTWYWGGGVHWWAWGLGVLTTFVFWGLVIWAIVALVSWARDSRPESLDAAGPPGPGLGDDSRPGEEAELILARRFAAGEIDAEEYHRRLEVLRGQHPPGGK